MTLGPVRHGEVFRFHLRGQKTSRDLGQGAVMHIIGGPLRLLSEEQTIRTRVETRINGKLPFASGREDDGSDRLLL